MGFLPLKSNLQLQMCAVARSVGSIPHFVIWPSYAIVLENIKRFKYYQCTLNIYKKVLDDDIIKREYFFILF